MKNRTLFRTGIAGGVIAAICCFTPALVILLGVVGLSAWLAWLDYVLLPAMVLFLGLAICGGIRMARKRRGDSEVGEAS